MGGGAKAHQVLIQGRVGLHGIGGQEFRRGAAAAVRDPLALHHRRFRIEQKTPVRHLKAEHGKGAGRGGIGHAGEGQKQVAGLVGQDGERRIGLRRARRHQRIGVDGILAQRPQVEHGLQPRGEPNCCAGILRRHAVAGATVAHGFFVGHGAFAQAAISMLL